MVQILTPTRQKPKTFLQSIVGGAVDAIPEAVKDYQTRGQPSAKEKEIMLTHQLQGKNQQALEAQKQSGLSSRTAQGNSFLNSIMNRNQQGQSGQKRSLSDITAEEALQAENMGLKGVSAAREASIKKDKEHEDRLREKESVKNLLRETGDYDEEDIERLSESYDVSTARSLNLKKKEPSPYEPTAQKLAAERTAKYIDQVEVKGRAADEKVRGLEEGRTLHKNGATGFKVTNFLADYFAVPALADPGSKAFNASMKSQYSGIGDIVKGKVSNFEFETFKQRIASAEDSPQAAESLIVSALMESKIAQKERDLVNQKRQEYYEQGKSEPSNFDLQIQDELRPYADLILAQTNRELLNILNPTKKNNPNKQTLDDIWGK